MAGFFRRFASMPSVEVLTEIEGVVAIDGVQPGEVSGVGAGVVALVGEFADVTYGVAVSAAGVVTTNPDPIEIFSAADFEQKLGGFDETIGQFGGDCGNGWLECKNKRFARLICVPINIAAAQGARLFRQLPTCTSATDPNPVVEVVGATVPAGTEFLNGTNRVRSAKRIDFAGTPDYHRAVDGAITLAGGVAAFQAFVSAGAAFTTIVRADGKVGVKVGDILVLGVVGGAGALGANAGTYRVRLVTNATTLSLEKLDGTTFDWTTGVAQPFRLYTSNVADSGGEYAQAAQGGYTVPARPLDASIAINITMSPTVVPDAITADDAAPLSGLQMRTSNGAGLVHVAAVHAVNVANSATVDALYDTAIDSLLVDDVPEREANIVWSARKSDTIRSLLRAHVLKQKAQGVGRIAHLAPELDVVSVTTVTGDAAPGVGAKRAREVVYNWPGVKTFVKEAVGKSVLLANGLTTLDGMLDTPSDGWAVAVESVLAPERNPGEATETTQQALAGVMGIQTNISGMSIDVYKRLRARGIMAPRIDKDSGPIFQSGVTSSLTSGEKEISVRRFSFFVQDSLAVLLKPFVKLLLTEQVKDAIVSIHDDFFSLLLSEGNPSLQRIAAYRIDPIGGNTPLLSRAGIYVVRHFVEMIPEAGTIVLDSKVGRDKVEVVPAIVG